MMSHSRPKPLTISTSTMTPFHVPPAQSSPNSREGLRAILAEDLSATVLLCLMRFGMCSKKGLLRLAHLNVGLGLGPMSPLGVSSLDMDMEQSPSLLDFVET